MDDGFQILIYVAFGVVWLISTLKANKKRMKEKNKSIVANFPKAKEQLLEKKAIAKEELKTVKEKAGEKLEEVYSNVDRKPDLYEEKIARLIENKKKENDYFLDRDPYKKSKTSRYKKPKVPILEVEPLEEVVNEDNLDFSEVNWAKAVIYSEILRPKF